MVSAQMRMPPQLPQAPVPFLGDVIGNRGEVAAVFGKLAVMKRVAPDFAIDGRAVTTELAGHLIDWNFALDQVMKTPVDRQGLVADSSGTCQNLQSEAIEIIGMSHLEIECTRLNKWCQS